jgi:hypothetical protein
MPLMNEAMSKADFDRQEKGLAPLKQVKSVKPDYVKPDEKDELLFSDITLNGFEPKLLSAKLNNRKNDEGVLFIGYEVTIDLISKKEDPIEMRGWMVEGEFMTFVRHYRSQISQQVISW